MATLVKFNQALHIIVIELCENVSVLTKFECLVIIRITVKGETPTKFQEKRLRVIHRRMEQRLMIEAGKRARGH